MSRRNAAIKREILPDPKFSSKVLAKFINMIMKDGKKSTAENIVYQALDTVISTLGQTADTTPQIFEDILDKVKPVVDCLLYTSPSPRDTERSRMPSSA